MIRKNNQGDFVISIPFLQCRVLTFWRISLALRSVTLIGMIQKLYCGYKRGLFHVLFVISIVLLSGCATTREMLTEEPYAFFSVTSARGDDTRVYARGVLELNYKGYANFPGRHTACMVIDLKDGKVISSSLPEKGDFPTDAFEYPEISSLEMRPSRFYSIENKKMFIKSGQNSCFWDNAFYIRNPDDSSDLFMFHVPSKIPPPQHATSCEATLYYATYPFVFGGAVVMDIVTFPFQLYYYVVLGLGGGFL